MNLVQYSQSDNSSLFDSIRHYDEQGNEFWLARELMTVLGYKQWQKFNGVIENAKENLETVADSVIDHITPMDKLVKRPQGGGTRQLDYVLSRLACYHVALSCDSRGNNAVKMAKHYFAVKTREAEVIIPKQNDEIETLKLKLTLANAEKDVALAQQKLLDTRHYIVTALPEPIQQKILGYQEVEKKIVEKVIYREDEFLRNDSTVNKTYLCKRYGIMSKNGKPDYTRLRKILASANLPKEAWCQIKDVQVNQELKREYLNVLDNLIIDDSRQLWIAE